MDTKDKIIQWLLSDDTGISSMAIVSQMTGFKTGQWGDDYPTDGYDFGRCQRLLEKIPEFMVRIEEMAQSSPQWAVLVEHWHELTQLYLKPVPNKDEVMHDRMRQILAKAPDKNRIDLGSGVSVYLMSKD